MKKVISLLLILIMLLSSINLTFAEDSGFKDINNHWGKNEIIKGKERGFIDGYPDGTFKPNGEVNYGMAIKILDVVFMKNSKTYKEGFNIEENQNIDYENMIDKLGVDKNSYAYKHFINLLKGILSRGTANLELPKGFYDDLNNLDFNKPIKRGALFGLIHQLMVSSLEEYNKIHSYNEMKYDKDLDFTNTDYLDVKDIYTLIEQELVKGNGNPTKNSDLKLDEYLTRAELTTMANRIYDYFNFINSSKYSYVEKVREMISDKEYTIEAPGSVTINNSEGKYTFGVVEIEDIDVEAYIAIGKDEGGNYTELSKLLLWNTLDLYFENNLEYLYDEIMNLAITLPDIKYEINGRDTMYGVSAYEVDKRLVQIFYTEYGVSIDIYEENTGEGNFIKISE